MMVQFRVCSLHPPELHIRACEIGADYSLEEQTGPMMYKVSQVAEKLNVSESIVYALIESGRLACHRIGVGRGTIRVSAADLDAYLASCRVQKGEEPRSAPRPRLKHIKL